MKAKSMVLRSTQKPYTMWGMPPTLIAITAGLTAPVMLLFIGLQMPGLALFSFLALFAMGAIKIYHAQRRDHHVETLLFLPQQILQGRKKRVLLPGAPPLSKRRKFKKRRNS